MHTTSILSEAFCLYSYTSIYTQIQDGLGILSTKLIGNAPFKSDGWYRHQQLYIEIRPWQHRIDKPKEVHKLGTPLMIYH